MMRFAAPHHTAILSFKRSCSRNIITGYPRKFYRKVASFPKHEPFVVNSRRNLASSSSVSNKNVTTTTVAGASSLPAAQSQSTNIDTGAVTVEGGRSLTIPIDFDTSSSILGEESQILQVQLKPNQVLRAESGAMLFMTQGLEMETSITANKNNTAGGVLNEGFRRMMTGQNLFFSDYTYTGKEGTMGTVALGTDFPSKILRFPLGEYGGKIVCQKGALLASSLDVDVQMEFTKKLTAGFFGGEGFVLQGLVGDGDVFCKAGGTVTRKELREGETIRVSSGCLVAFTQDVQYDVQTMPGFKNVLFGGEGLFVTTLTGPGTIWLQGMPPDRLISEIARRIPSGGIGMGIPIGLMGGGGDSSPDVEGGDDNISESTAADEDTATDDFAASTDQDNTTSSSDMLPGGGGSVDDAESPSALFGDAVSTPDFNSSGADVPPLDSVPDMDETTSFSTEDTTSFPNDDTTSFGDDDFTGDQFDQDESSFTEDTFSTEDSFKSSDSGIADSDSEEGGLFRQLWDFFTDDD